MRGQAMLRVVTQLKGMGYDLKSMRALEFFARQGDWQTIVYADSVGELEAWEINPQFEGTLKENLPRAKVRIGDSFEIAREYLGKSCFDLIVIDNPMNRFGEGSRWCEHFEALPLALKMLSTPGLVIFNINWAPFNYDHFPEWKSRREKFYAEKSTDRLSPEFLVKFYKNFFLELGWITDLFCIFERNADYFGYGVARLRRQEE